MQPGEMLEWLAEGERKAVAKSSAVANQVIKTPMLMPDLIALLGSPNTTVASHAAHAMLTVSKHAPDLLKPYCAELVEALASDQWEVQEQLGKILPQLPLDTTQQASVWKRFNNIFYNGKSSIARTCALQAMVDMGSRFSACRDKASEAIVFAIENGSKAMQARARNLVSIFHLNDGCVRPGAK